MEWKLKTESELKKVAEVVLAELVKRDNNGEAAVLALHGDLGAGKTTFMQVLAEVLEVSETVTSPTFVIMKNYELQDRGWKNLVHIDAYRIEDNDEMRPLGLEKILEEKANLVCIEWAEKIADLLPSHTLNLTFSITGTGRHIELT